MRGKIIIVYAAIVALLGGLSVFFVSSRLDRARHDPRAAEGRARSDVSVIALRLELLAASQQRWTDEQTSSHALDDVLARGTAAARGEAATAWADRIVAAGGTSLRPPPSLVALFDPRGVLLGRNGTSLGRGEDQHERHPELRVTAAEGRSGARVWFDPSRGEQHLVSMAPVGPAGKALGVLVVGVPLNEALAAASVGSSAEASLLVQLRGAQNVEVVASRQESEHRETLLAAATQALTGGEGGAAGARALRLEQLGAGQVAVAAWLDPATLPGLDGMPWVLLGLTGVGLLLVVLAGWFLGGYFLRPIHEIEDGLLTVLDGDSHHRFRIEHAELGGLGFRLDQLLNQLMGVDDAATDAEGRISGRAGALEPAFEAEPPPAEPSPTADPGLAQRLGAEPEEIYRRRVYDEYMGAKRALGEDASHVGFEAFSQRLRSMESEALAKHGQAVRYQVKLAGHEILLLAIPV